MFILKICALSIVSGNSVLLKGGSEALNTNKILHKLVIESLGKYVPKEAVILLNSNEELDDLLALDAEYIDLIIPRGSSKLVRRIQEKSRKIPVLGHVEGICHVFVDKDADKDIAVEIGNYKLLARNKALT
jgi:delta-1-pyrroline-5-carboxylate synthetase